MKIKLKFFNLLKSCKIEDSKMLSVLHDNVNRFLYEDLRFPVWKVTYTYKLNNHTIRSYRYIIEKESAYDLIDFLAEKLLKEYHSNRVTDIKIDEIDFMGDLILPVESK